MKKTRKKIINAIALTVILTLFIQVIPSDILKDETIIEIESFTLELDETKKTSIMIKEGLDIAIVSLQLTWDPAILYLTEVKDDSGISDFDSVFYTINHTLGILILDAYKFGDDGLDGDRTIADLYFETATNAKEGDSSDLTITDTKIVSSSMQYIDHTVSNGTAMIIEQVISEYAVLFIEDVFIPYNGKTTGYLKVLNVTDLAFLTLNVTWDPSIINITSINSSSIVTDFDSVFYDIDYDNGLLQIDAYKFGYGGLQGNVTIAEITYTSTMTSFVGDTSPLEISDSTLWNIPPDTMDHLTEDGGNIPLDNSSSMTIHIDDITINDATDEISYLNISNCEKLAIISINVHWDSTLLNLIDINISETISDFDVVFFSINEEQGLLNLDAYKFGSEGLEGDVCVAKLIFEATQTAQEGDFCDLSLSNSSLWNATPYTITHLIDNGLATIVESDADDTAILSIQSITNITEEVSFSFLDVTNVSDLAVLSLRLSWDPSIINVTEVNTSDMISDFDSVFFILDYINGTLDFDAYKFGTTGIYGDACIASIGFVAVPGATQGDISDLIITNSVLYDTSANSLAHDIINGIGIIGEIIPLDASCNGPYTGKESKTVQLQGGATGGITPYAFAWDLDDDGFYDDSDQQNPTWIWNNQGTYTIALQVTDFIGTIAYDTTSVTIDEESTGGNGGSTGGGGVIPPPENTKPVAIISVSSRVAYVNEILTFNASESYDPDGDILSYTWDFDDNSTSDQITIEHMYTSPGTYVVSLTVDDLKGGSNSSLLQIYIKPGDNPPQKPSITGPSEGSINTPITFNIVSTDPDNDTLTITIDWDDGTNSSREHIASGTTINETHTWKSAGVYLISIQAIDMQDQPSKETELQLLINAKKIDTIGFLLDTDDDGIYDAFIQTKDGQQQNTLYQDGSYLIDADGDGIWDYIYDPETETLTEYVESEGEPGEDNNICLILFVILILLIAILSIYSLVKNKDKKEETTKEVEESIDTEEPVPSDDVTKKDSSKEKDDVKEKPTGKKKASTSSTKKTASKKGSTKKSSSKKSTSKKTGTKKTGAKKTSSKK